MRKLLPIALTMVFWGVVSDAQGISLPEAADAFATARAISERDAGHSWGVPVCGPMLFADSETRDVVANQTDAEGRLQRDGSVWTGKLPVEIPIANTARDWAGVRWTMVMWPLPAETRRRAQLLAHECFHRIQPALNLPANDVINGHLNGKEGRTWLILEWRALERAVLASGARRKRAIADTLLFRSFRRSLIASAAASENALEMNEGLAEYTGVRLSNPDETDRRGAAISMLWEGPARTSFVRSFAYASGPAYGVLLDESGVSWKTTLTPDADLGQILARAYGISVRKPDEASARTAARSYGGDEVIAAESRRQGKLEQRLAEIRRRFIEGPVLVLPVFGKFEFGFNPNDVVPLDERSTVYGWLRVSDEWGVLEANGGMLVREKGQVTRSVVPAPAKTNGSDGSTVSGDDWKLELKAGFRIAPGPRPGDQGVTREKD